MKPQILALLLVFFCGTAQCHSQGTLHITFDGPPEQPPGSAINITNYIESGMSFRPLVARYGGLVRVGSEPTGGRPDDGTAYLVAALPDSLMFSLANGAVFEALSVDLAELGTLFQTPLVVDFVGYRQDGSIVTTAFTTDGIIDGTGPLADFQTFYFDNAWSGLTRVEVPSPGWSLDNLYVFVPEPTVGALLLLGGLLTLGIRSRRRTGTPARTTPTQRGIV